MKCVWLKSRFFSPSVGIWFKGRGYTLIVVSMLYFVFNIYLVQLDDELNDPRSRRDARELMSRAFAGCLRWQGNLHIHAYSCVILHMQYIFMTPEVDTECKPVERLLNSSSKWIESNWLFHTECFWVVWNEKKVCFRIESFWWFKLSNQLYNKNKFFNRLFISIDKSGSVEMKGVTWEL